MDHIPGWFIQTQMQGCACMKHNLWAVWIYVGSITSGEAAKHESSWVTVMVFVSQFHCCLEFWHVIFSDPRQASTRGHPMWLCAMWRVGCSWLLGTLCFDGTGSLGLWSWRITYLCVFACIYLHRLRILDIYYCTRCMCRHICIHILYLSLFDLYANVSILL